MDAGPPLAEVYGGRGGDGASAVAHGGEKRGETPANHSQIRAQGKRCVRLIRSLLRLRLPGRWLNTEDPVFKGFVAALLSFEAASASSSTKVKRPVDRVGWFY
jgi:hypothetical protein